MDKKLFAELMESARDMERHAAGKKVEGVREVTKEFKSIFATHPRSDVVAAGKLKSTDGHYGLRFGHNTDAIITDFKKTKAQ